MADDVIDELRAIAQDPVKLTRDGFGFLQSVSLLLNADQGRSAVQELVLRALEQQNSLRKWQPLLDALVRELGLFPYLKAEDLSSRDLLAYETHRPDALDDATVSHGPQARVYWSLLRGDNVALSAPASFGKSLIVDAVIASGKFANVVIVVPTIALMDETRKRLAGRFRGRYKIITQPHQPRSDRNIFVFTQERVLESDQLSQVDFFVIDEFYKMDPRREDENRWPLLNQA